MFLDVDSFQGGLFTLSKNISDIISFMFYCLNSPQGSVYLVFCGRSGCSASTDDEVITISCFLDADSFTGFVKGPRRSFYNPTRFSARFFVKLVFLQQPYCSQYNRTATTRPTANANLPNQTCSQVHMIQVHMTSFSLCYFVFSEISTLNSLPLSISGQDLYRRERTA